MLQDILNRIFGSKMTPQEYIRMSKDSGARRDGVARGHRMTRDIAFQYRMGAGFLGDVNRSYPFTIEPCLIDASAPPTAYGQPVLVDPTTQGVRALATGDYTSGAFSIYGITVRPFPFQANTTTPTIGGSSIPPISGLIDVLRSGYIMVPVYGACVKGGTVYIWVTATSVNHVENTFEITTNASNVNIVSNPNTTWNGSPDTSAVLNANINVAELAFNI